MSQILCSLSHGGICIIKVLNEKAHHHKAQKTIRRIIQLDKSLTYFSFMAVLLLTQRAHDVKMTSC